MRVLLATLALLISIPASADDWTSITLGSRHKERDRGYNERNFGLGIERALPWEGWRFAGGFYENSYYRTSWYAAAVVEMWGWRGWKLGGAAGLVTGYTDGRADLLLAPVLAWEGRHFGVNFFPVTPKIVGVQIKFRF